MAYMDEQDRRIQEQMKKEGKVRVEGYGKIVSQYFENKLNKEVSFMFLRVYYEYFDANHQVYSIDEQRWVTRPKNKKVYSLLPFLAEKDVVPDKRMFSLSLSGIIDENNRDSKIMEVLPQGLHYITKEQMNEAFLNAGYEDPFYDTYFYSMMDYPEVNIYARPIEKAKNDELNFGEPFEPSGRVSDELAKTLEELYQKGKLPKVGEIPNPYMNAQTQEDISRTIDHRTQLSEQEISEYHGTSPLNVIPGPEVLGEEKSKELEKLYQEGKLSKVGIWTTPFDNNMEEGSKRL